MKSPFFHSINGYYNCFLPNEALQQFLYIEKKKAPVGWTRPPRPVTNTTPPPTVTTYNEQTLNSSNTMPVENLTDQQPLECDF